MWIVYINKFNTPNTQILLIISFNLSTMAHIGTRSKLFLIGLEFLLWLVNTLLIELNHGPKPVHESKSTTNNYLITQIPLTPMKKKIIYTLMT